jgi:hypothetical protein
MTGMAVASDGSKAPDQAGFAGILMLHTRFPRPVGDVGNAASFATSSLLQGPYVERLLPPGQRAGVLTADAASLSADHLQAVDVATDTPVEGIDPNGAFARTLFDDREDLDQRAAERDVVDAAQRLLLRRPDIGAFVLECTNMPPYASAVATATGRPVYDVLTLLDAIWRRRLPAARAPLPGVRTPPPATATPSLTTRTPSVATRTLRHD